MKLLTKKEVAALLKVSTRTVENFTNRGILPKIIIGNKTIRYPEDDIMGMLRKMVTREVRQ